MGVGALLITGGNEPCSLQYYHLYPAPKRRKDRPFSIPGKSFHPRWALHREPNCRPIYTDEPTAISWASFLLLTYTPPSRPREKILYLYLTPAVTAVKEYSPEPDTLKREAPMYPWETCASNPYE